MRKSKYGTGLVNEIVKAVRTNKLCQPFSVADIKSFCTQKGWFPSDNYLRSVLYNYATSKYTPTNPHRLKKVSPGKFKIIK